MCNIGHRNFYNIRFPNLYKQISQVRDEILVMPSVFTKVTESAHWQVLNRSRYIENVSYVISPCSLRKILDGAESFVHSLIIDPWGKIMKDGGKRKILLAQI